MAAYADLREPVPTPEAIDRSEKRFAAGTSFGSPYDDLNDSDKEDLLLTDADTFADWLGAECMATGFQTVHHTNDATRAQMMVDRATVAQLVCCTLSFCNTLALAARSELRARYLASLCA